MIRLALDRPVSTLVAAATLSAIGLFSLLRLPVSLLPSLERPRVIVTAEAAGKPAGQMLRDVTEPLERALGSTPGVESIVSETEDGLTIVTLTSGWDADADDLRTDVGRRLDRLSRGVADSISVTVAGDLTPTIEVAVTGGASGAERALFAERVLAPELSHLAGAGRIELVGLSRRTVVVRLIPAALAARRISAETVVDRLDNVGKAIGAGQVRDGETVRPLLVRENIASIDELRALRIEHPGGVAVLGDVAAVTVEDVDDGSQYRINGDPAVLLRLYRAPDENAVELTGEARERVAILRARSKPLELAIVRDGSAEIAGALRGLGGAALIGILLGTLVLRWMLGAWQPTISLSVVIPVSLLLSFAAFFAAGVPLDVISLSGLALAAGMIVDNSIVVLEAIESRRTKGERHPEYAGTRGVATAVAASTVTTVVVFVPLLYLEGVARAFFGEQAFAIAACVSASLVFALTLTPVLAKRKGAAGEGRSPGRERYLAALEKALARPRPVWGAAFALTLAALGLVAVLRVELFPFAPQREIRVDFQFSKDLTPEEAFREGQRLEADLRRLVPAAELVSAQLLQGLSREGRPGRPETWAGRIEMRFRDPGAADRGLGAATAHLARRPGVRAAASYATSAFVEGLASRRDRLEAETLAESDEAALDLAKRLVESVDRGGGRARPGDSALARRAPFLEWKPEALAGAGVTRDQLESQVRRALSRSDAGMLSLRGVEKSILVESLRSGAIESLPIVLPPDEAGLRRIVPIGAIAGVRYAERYPALVRIDGRPAARVIVDRDGTELTALRAAIDRIPLRPLQQIRLGGEAAEIDSSFEQLRLVILLGVLLVFFSIAAFYESFLSPLLIMVSVPVAAAGGLVALLVAGESLNVMSLIGVVLLAGIVVNQTIILVDRADAALLEGEDAAGAMRIAASERYRPIMMTTATTLLGMLPLVVFGGEGSELRRALATTVIGGLISSTTATLLVVPLLYVEIDRIRCRWRERRNR